MDRALLVATVLLCLLGGGPARHAVGAENAGPGLPAYPPERVSFLTKSIQERIDDILLKTADPNNELRLRDMAAAAQCYLLLGDSKKSEAMMRAVFKLQDMDPASAHFGGVLWQNNHPEIDDENSNDFTALHLGGALARYRDQLSEDFKKEARPHLAALIGLLRKRAVTVGYTNIYLMHLASLALLGEATDDPEAMQAATKLLDAWLTYTKTQGVEEYDSSTYSVVQIDSLAMLYNFTRRPEWKEKVKAALDLLWSDLAANYFAGNQTLSGPQSRTYEWLFGDDAANQLYYLVGLRDRMPGLVGFSDTARVWVNCYPPDAYRPAPAVLEPARVPVRTVVSHYGPKPASDRYNYITENFALGSSNRFYLLHDKQISASLHSEKGLPFIEFVPDVFDDPYGHHTAREASGQAKVSHVHSTLGTVQEKGNLLALADVASFLGKDAFTKEITSLASNVVFPGEADGLFLDRKPVTLAKGATLPIPTDATFVVREGKAAVAMRFFVVDGAGGGKASVALKYDGQQWGAARLVAYHYQGETKTLANDVPARAGFFMVAADCDSERDFNAFLDRTENLRVIQAVTNGVWQAELTAPDGTRLEVGLDLPGRQIADRRINGAPVKSSLFNVNGIDLMSKYLGGLP